MYINAQYYSHLLVQSKYNFIIKLIIIFLIYISFYSLNIVHCMNDPYFNYSSNQMIRKLIDENRTLSQNYNILVQHNQSLQHELFKNYELTLQYRTEIEQYKMQLHEAQVQVRYFSELAQAFETTQRNFLSEKQALANELKDAYLKIEKLKGNNLRLQLDLIQAKHDLEIQQTLTRPVPKTETKNDV